MAALVNWTEVASLSHHRRFFAQEEFRITRGCSRVWGEEYLLEVFRQFKEIQATRKNLSTGADEERQHESTDEAVLFQQAIRLLRGANCIKVMSCIQCTFYEKRRLWAYVVIESRESKRLML